MNKDCLWGLEPKDRHCEFCSAVCSARPLEQGRSTALILPLSIKATIEKGKYTNTMRAKDLMVGDWVYDTILKGNTKVEILSLSGIRGDYHDNVWDEKTFESIPLTEEILVKNGFERKSERLRHIEFELVINPDTEDEHWMVVKLHPANENCDVNWAHIYYVPSSRVDLNTIETKIVDCCVHHLQHILRLCGIDKDIELV